MQSKSCVQFKIKLHIKYHPYIKILVPLDRTSTKILIKSICNLQVVVLLRRNILHGPANYKVSLSTVIIYKEMFLGCDWLIRVQLIQNITQNSAKICNNSAKICNNSAKICNNSAKICNKLFERWDLLAEKPKIWRPNFHVCLKISSKFQHNLGFFSDNYDHKANSEVCWNFVHKIFSHGFYKHEFFKRRNSRMSALA